MDNKTSKIENGLWYKIRTDLDELHFKSMTIISIPSLLYIIILTALIGIYIYKIVPDFMDSKHPDAIWIFAIVSFVVTLAAFLLLRLLIINANMITEEIKAISTLKRKLIEDVQHREILIQEKKIKISHKLEDKQ